MSDKTDSEELKRYGDDVRLELALQTIKDVMWHFEEGCEGRRSAYDVLACLLEDLIGEGICPACVNEVVGSVFDATGSDPETHNDDKGALYH